MMGESSREHWNKIFASNPVTQLSWYEPQPFPSVQLIERCAVPHHAPIADIGSGASTLISSLLELGYQNLYAIDISDVALEKARTVLGKEHAAQVHWIIDDIVNPSAVVELTNVAIWHDRAVFHFLTEEDHRKTYHSVLDKVVKSGGFVIIATFALNGAPECSGLPVKRHSVQDLREFLGEGFSLVESSDYVYRMPWGDLRPYVYTRFQKVG